MSSARIRRLARRRTVGLLAAILLIIAGAAVVGFAVRDGPLPKRFAAVEPGVLYRSAQPEPHQIANLARDYGIKTIVIAREDHDQQVEEEAQAAKENGLTIVRAAIESRTPITDQQLREFFRCVDDPRLRPVLVHCSAGRHRTGYLCGVYRIERQGWSVDQAVEEMLSFGAAEDGDHPAIEQLKQYVPGRFPRATSPPTTSSSAGAQS